MTEIFISFAFVLLFAAVLTVLQKRKNDKILRELKRIQYESQYAVNCIEMGRLTPHGPRDRDDYLNEAVQASRDAEEIAFNLAKEF